MLWAAPLRQQHERARAAAAATVARAALKALIFEEGALLDRSEIRLRALNDAFERLQVVAAPDDASDKSGSTAAAGAAPLRWSRQDYELAAAGAGAGGSGAGVAGAQQAQRAGKLASWYFGRSGYPASSVTGGRPPSGKEERDALVGAVAEASAQAYERMVG